MNTIMPGSAEEDTYRRLLPMASRAGRRVDTGAAGEFPQHPVASDLGARGPLLLSFRNSSPHLRIP